MIELIKSLSERQKEVCKSFIKTKGEDVYKKISDDLGISKATARTHMADIYCTLQVSSQAELMYYLLVNLYIKPVRGNDGNWNYYKCNYK